MMKMNHDEIGLCEKIEVSGPAVTALKNRKDSQGQPPSSGDLTYDQILAVARALYRTNKVQQYLLGRVHLTSDMPHKEYQRRAEIAEELRKSDETLQVFFFGD